MDMEVNRRETWMFQKTHMNISYKVIANIHCGFNQGQAT